MFRSPADAETAHSFAASDSSAVRQAKDHAAAAARQETMARFEREGQQDSVAAKLGLDGQRAVEH